MAVDMVTRPTHTGEVMRAGFVSGIGHGAILRKGRLF